jgi:hypothetical protein
VTTSEQGPKRVYSLGREFAVAGQSQDPKNTG